MQQNNIYIQAMEMVCSAGLNKDEVFTSVINGKTGIKKYANFLLDDSLASIGKIDFELSFNELMIKSIQNLLDNSELQDFSNTFSYWNFCRGSGMG